MNEKVRIVFLGGVGEVTKNMFVYEYWRDNSIVDSIIVDCGIGFSDEGDEIILPDVSYVINRKSTLRAVVLTHGHEDHISGLSTLLNKVSLPVYGTKLTLGLAEGKLIENNIHADLRRISYKKRLNFGSFQVEYVHVTHSIPDAANLIIYTPIGIFYHASDFKFDWSPVDGRITEVGKIALVGERGVLCLLSDCVRSERDGYTLSEEHIQEQLELQVRKARGKVIFTTMSSNISRIQQAINVALEHKKKVAFVGRSMRQNTEVAQKLGYLKIPRKTIIHPRKIKKLPPHKVFIIAAGSQAQEDSSLSRIADAMHREVSISSHDMVLFSADPIPGYEKQVHNLVNKLTRLGADVVYSDINDELHVSGHGASHDLMLMMGLTRPSYIIPIGGEPRQVQRYSVLAEKMGYTEKKILRPEEKDAVVFTSDHQVKILKNIA